MRRHIVEKIKSMFIDITGSPPTPDQHSKAMSMVPFNFTPSHEYAVEQMIKSEFLAKQNFISFCGETNVTEKIVNKSLVKNQKLLVFGLTKNIENNIVYLKKLISDLRTYFDRVCFYFYHNNFSDKSVQILQEWMLEDENVKGTFDDNEDIIVVNKDGTLGNMIPVFAKMRNKNIHDAITHFGTDYDYFLMTNTDFTESIDVSGIIKSFGLAEQWSIICANRCFQKSFYHYDAFALRFFNDEKPIDKLYPQFPFYYGTSAHWLDKLHIFNGWTKVYSGCGDMMIIDGKQLNNVLQRFGEFCEVNEDLPSKCELISLCERINGDIWVSPYLVYPATMSLEGSLYPKPMMFIPRDAGFFSVFNFYIGSLTKGGRVYPYYNKLAFQSMNKENRHFCYWSDNDNSWFDYFEPVEFYHGDIEHESGTFTNYSVTQGELASTEFMFPNAYRNLMLDKERFAPWRIYVNNIFKKYIKIKADIVNEVNTYWNNTFQRFGNVIGVHYRHPSHYVESGEIYLRDYFKVVDGLLLKHPYAKIFIASDNEYGILAFEKRYGTKCVFSMPDIDRVDLDNILEWAHAKSKTGAESDDMDFINGVGYQLHYTKCQNNEMSSKIGKDILKEVICLSKCKWLVHITSNVSFAVSYINPYLDMHIITDGN